jgi:hypothetical protein
MTVDRNQAAASVAHRVSEVIAIYPITPSSSVGELSDEWSKRRRADPVHDARRGRNWHSLAEMREQGIFSRFRSDAMNERIMLMLQDRPDDYIRDDGQSHARHARRHAPTILIAGSHFGQISSGSFTTRALWRAHADRVMVVGVPLVSAQSNGS